MAHEQIFMSEEGANNACLVDCWGRVHQLSGETEIGRIPEGMAITIHESSISRRHASIHCEHEGLYVIRDRESTNGTTVAGRKVRGTMELVTGDLVFVGSVGFYFISPMPSQSETSLSAATLSRSTGRTQPNPALNFSDFEDTALNGLEELPLSIAEATGGGGGFAYVDGAQVQLSLSQLELLGLLIRRMHLDRKRPCAVRGYVHSSEVLAGISWDTAHPSDSHVRQLVRRLRRALERSGGSELIESQKGLGYRLRVLPT